MRVLAISDKVEPSLYSPAVMERVGKVDLILSCGDLPHYYIEYLMTMLGRPTYYVFGNHGREIQYSGGKGDDKPQSDRWGIFIGHWAPTFFALGIALKHEEESKPRA